MGKKRLAILSGLFISLEAVAAQGIAGPGQAQGIIPLISQLIGVNVTNPGYAIGVAATFGVMVSLVYVTLKVAAEKLDLARSLTGSGTNGGRNMLLIISVLIGLSTLGTGFFGTLVSLYGMAAIWLLLIIAVVALFAVGSFASYGVPGAAAFAGAAGESLSAQGAELSAETKKKRAKSKKKRAEADKKMREMKKEAQKIREDIEDGDGEEAAELIQRSLKNLENIQRMSSSQLEEDRKEVEDAINDLQDALDVESGEYDEAASADKRIKRAEIFIDKAAEEASNVMPGATDEILIHLALIEGTSTASIANERGVSIPSIAPDFQATSAVTNPSEIPDLQGLENLGGAGNRYYGLKSAEEDLEKVRKKLELVSEDIQRENTDEQEAFSELIEATESLRDIHKLIIEMQEILDEAEQEDKSLKQLANRNSWKDLFDKADQEMDEERSLEEGEQKLEEEEEKIRQQLQEALKYINKHLQRDEDVIGVLEDALEGTDTIKDDLQVLDNYFDPIPTGEPEDQWFDGDADRAIRSMLNMVAGLEKVLGDLRDEDQIEEKRDQKVIQEINEYMNDL